MLNKIIKRTTLSITSLVLVLASFTISAKGVLRNSYPIEIIEVKDGDTIKVRVHQWLDTYLETNIRVLGVDTPEKGWRAKCDFERELGEQATAFTKEFVKHGSLSITNISNDKFGGRLDADVIRDDGVSLAAELIKNGYGYAYFGKTKHSWCANN